MARLFVLSGNSIGETHDFDATLTLGRGDDVDVTISDASVSRRHARLVPQPEAGVWSLIDLKSANGVFLGGERVKKALVRNGETFCLGNVEIRLKDESAAEEAGPESADELDWADEEPVAGPAPEPAAEPAAAPAVEPAAVEVEPEIEPEIEPELELELEFDGDLEEALSASPPPVVKPPAAPPSAPAAPEARRRPRPPKETDPGRAGAIASQDREARRLAAMGGTSKRPSAATEGGRPILQYDKVRSSGTDLAQLPGWQKLILAVLGAGLLCAAAYGAFALTVAAKGAPTSDAP